MNRGIWQNMKQLDGPKQGADQDLSQQVCTDVYLRGHEADYHPYTFATHCALSEQQNCHAVS